MTMFIFFIFKIDVKAENATQAQQQGQQQTTFQSFIAIAKSLFLRAIVIYFITSFIRKNTTPTDTVTTSKIAANNIFDNGTLLVCSFLY